MFRQIAPRYDSMNHLLSAGIDHWWRYRTVRRLRLDTTEPVLDVCTGTGDLALAIAKKAQPSTPIIGCDFCHEMLEIGRRKDVAGRVKFIEGDAANLPFDDDSFQAVTVAFGLRNVADTDRGLSELRRVCRPGGQIMILEFSQPQMFGIRQVYGFYFRNILPRIGQLLARNNQSAYDYLPNSVGQFPSGQQLIVRMEGAGMRNASQTPLTMGVATLYEATK